MLGMFLKVNKIEKVKHRFWVARYLSVGVEDRQCGIQHTASHLTVPVVQSIRYKKHKDWSHLILP